MADIKVSLEREISMRRPCTEQARHGWEAQPDVLDAEDADGEEDWQHDALLLRLLGCSQS